MDKVGFIGLGTMGLPMAINMQTKSGKLVVGYDIDPGQREKLCQKGGQAVERVEDIYASCPVIFLCLPKNELVRSTVEAIGEVVGEGTVIVDLSSTAPMLIRELCQKMAGKGISLLDCPVSGGETGAVAGTLVIMCGGDKAVFDEVKPLLLTMGNTATYMGESGNGNVAKLANNMIVACNLASVGEAFAYAVKAGLDPQALLDAIKDGYAGSTVLSIKAPKLIAGDYSPSARVEIHQKDLRNAMDFAADMGVEIPFSGMVLGLMDQLEAMGKAKEDHCAVARIFERDMEITIAGGKQ